MKTIPASIWPIATAALLIGCKPSQRMPITGEVKLEFIGRDATDIHLRLKNQTPTKVSFWGARDWWWESVFPMGPRFECVLANSVQMHESPFPLIDGPAWREFMIGPSEEIDLVVSDSFLRGSDGSFPAGRCKFVLQLAGDAVVKSEEFVSVAASNI